MKRRNIFSGLAILTALLLITSVSGNGSDDHGTYEMNRERFHMGTDYMNINGTVDLTQEGIVFSVTMAPNMEANQMMGEGMGEGMDNSSDMGDGMGDGRGDGRNPEPLVGDSPSADTMGDDNKDAEHGRFMGDVKDPETMKNQMNITLFALVEFEDQGIPGFDGNDSVVSVYYLNSSTLNPVEFDGNRTYTITSPDGVFKLTLLASTGEQIGWKWSVEINSYDFVSNTSKLAMLHEITTLYKDIHMERGVGLGGGVNNHNNSSYMGLTNSTIRSDGKGTPMFFSWVANATVDGEVRDVTVTRGDVLAITIPQGDSIYYDPFFGVSQEVVSDIDGSIGLLSVDDTSSTTTAATFFPIIGLGLGVAIIILIRKNR